MEVDLPMIRISVPKEWVYTVIDPNTFNLIYRRLSIPKHIDMSTIRIDFPSWVIRHENGPPEFNDPESPSYQDWDIFMIFRSEEEAALFKLTYL